MSKKKKVIIILAIVVGFYLLMGAIAGIISAVIHANDVQKITIYCYKIESNKVEKIKITHDRYSPYPTFKLPVQKLDGWDFAGYVYSSNEYKQKNGVLQNRNESLDFLIKEGTSEVSQLFFNDYDTKKMYLAPVFKRVSGNVILHMASGNTQTYRWVDTYSKYKKSTYSLDDNNSPTFKMLQSGNFKYSYASQGFFTQSSGGTMFIDKSFNELVSMNQIIEQEHLYEHQLKYNLVYKYLSGNEETIALLDVDKCALPVLNPTAPEGYAFEGWYVENTQIKVNTNESVQALLDKLINVGVDCNYKTITLLPKFNKLKTTGDVVFK